MTGTQPSPTPVDSISVERARFGLQLLEIALGRLERLLLRGFRIARRAQARLPNAHASPSTTPPP